MLLFGVIFPLAEHFIDYFMRTPAPHNCSEHLMLYLENVLCLHIGGVNLYVYHSMYLILLNEQYLVLFWFFVFVFSSASHLSNY